MKIENFLELSANEPKWNLIGPMFDTSAIDYIKNLPTIYVDGGLNFKNDLGNRVDNSPTLSIGDGDSLKNEAKLDVLYSPEKDKSDLELALETVPENIDLDAHGFYGGRIDHQLVNIGTFSRHSSLKKSNIFLDNKIIFLPKGVYKLSHNGPFSLLSIEACELSIKGKVKYPLSEMQKTSALSGLTLSNEAHGEFTISTSKGIMFIPVEASCISGCLL
ncbi:MAG: hypothetical protein KC493_14025 [Bacteriovoracaceae bacterium]|nr:hypothetical protein [Bacteriovoracaceae bacterium]